MWTLLSNTTSETHTNYISSFYQTLGFTFTNSSTVYLICGFIIVLCMFATTLRNLIYKVLNLAVLSVFVVALWSYCTDITFIYVVYILTFVSAVVMLFLSVVLMLPASAIAVSKKGAVPVVLIQSNIFADVCGYFIEAGHTYLLLAVSYIVFFLLFIMPRTPVRRTSTFINAPRKSGFHIPSLISAFSPRWSARFFIESFLNAVCKWLLYSFNFFADLPGIINLYYVLTLSQDLVAKNRYVYLIIAAIYKSPFQSFSNLFFEGVWLLIGFFRHFRRFAFVNLAPYVECAVQFTATLSIFFTAVPLGFSGCRSGSFFFDSYFAQLAAEASAENLAAVQYVLYVGQPLLVIVSVTGLLVALVGAPFFISRDS